MRWTKIIAHKIILLVLLTTVGCYTIPEFPDIEKNDKEYFDYYGYGQPYPLAYLHWQNEQRSLRLMRYYNFFNYPVYQNRYPYYAYPTMLLVAMLIVGITIIFMMFTTTLWKTKIQK